MSDYEPWAQKLIDAHNAARPWRPFLLGTVPLVLCVLSLIVTPFVLAVAVFTPRLVAIWRTLP